MSSVMPFLKCRTLCDKFIKTCIFFSSFNLFLMYVKGWHGMQFNQHTGEQCCRHLWNLISPPFPSRWDHPACSAMWKCIYDSPIKIYSLGNIAYLATYWILIKLHRAEFQSAEKLTANFRIVKKTWRVYICVYTSPTNEDRER